MRARTHPAIIMYGIYLYFSSRSLRLAAKCLASTIKRTHVTIWKWIQKYSSLADKFRIDRHAVEKIFVDETVLQIDGKDYWLWLAYEPKLKRCLFMHLSRERTIFVCYHFFKQLRNRYGRKLILTDGALWYDQACRWLRLSHKVYNIEMKNRWKDSSNISRTGQNVLMTTFHAENQIATDSMSRTGSN